VLVRSLQAMDTETIHSPAKRINGSNFRLGKCGMTSLVASVENLWIDTILQISL